MKYTVQFFIDKFEKIPEELWIIYKFNHNGKSCANGHCGVRFSRNMERENINEESIGLKNIFNVLTTQFTFDTFKDYSNIAAVINNGNDDRYKQPTPRARILAALYDIKAMQEKEQPYSIDLTRQLAVLPSDRREVDVVKEPLKLNV